MVRKSSKISGAPGACALVVSLCMHIPTVTHYVLQNATKGPKGFYQPAHSAVAGPMINSRFLPAGVLWSQHSKLQSINGQFPDIGITWPIILPCDQTKWLVESVAQVCQRVVVAMVHQPPNGGCYWPKASKSGLWSVIKSWVHLHG